MTPKQYLLQTQGLDKRINAKLEQATRLHAMAMRCTSVLSGMPHGGSGHDWTDTMIKVAELEADIDKDVDCLVDLKREIMGAIATLPDERYRTLLEYRYLCGWGWQRIADAMHYDRTTIWRLHGEALLNITVPEQVATQCNIDM